MDAENGMDKGAGDRRPAYVRALQDERDAMAREIDEAAEQLHALRIYLQSPKFTADWPNQWSVNPQDVLDRLPSLYLTGRSTATEGGTD